MARRLPFGPVSGPGMVGAVAAAVLVAALVLTGRLLDVGGGDPSPPTRTSAASRAGTISTQAPYRLGGAFPSPPSWPVLAMANHLSYPAGHPTRPPPSAAAVACYHTEDQAAGAGYPVAPLPPGVLEIDGIYLTPTGRPLQARCQQVADRLHLVIPCPGLLPTAPPGAPVPERVPARHADRPGELGGAGSLLGRSRGLVVRPERAAPLVAAGHAGGGERDRPQRHQQAPGGRAGQPPALRLAQGMTSTG